MGSWFFSSITITFLFPFWLDLARKHGVCGMKNKAVENKMKNILNMFLLPFPLLFSKYTNIICFTRAEPFSVYIQTRFIFVHMLYGLHTKYVYIIIYLFSNQPKNFLAPVNRSWRRRSAKHEQKFLRESFLFGLG